MALTYNPKLPAGFADIFYCEHKYTITLYRGNVYLMGVYTTDNADQLCWFFNDIYHAKRCFGKMSKTVSIFPAEYFCSVTLYNDRCDAFNIGKLILDNSPTCSVIISNSIQYEYKVDTTTT